ncbi:hypothetical protein Hte_006392 [Hypoxylon texense]
MLALFRWRPDPDTPLGQIPNPWAARLHPNLAGRIEAVESFRKRWLSAEDPEAFFVFWYTYLDTDMGVAAKGNVLFHMSEYLRGYG